MLARLLHRLLVPAVAGVLASAAAQADIYRWVDAAGTVTYSNLPPPKGVRVTDVLKEVEPPATLVAAADRDAARSVEVQTLSERVRLLEREVDLANREALLAEQYRAPPPPPPSSVGCEAGSIACGPWSGPILYPGGVALARSPGFRRHPPFQAQDRFMAPATVRFGGGGRRR